MFRSMRSKIVGEALRNLSFSGRLRIRLEQILYALRGSTVIGGFLLFFGLQYLVFALLTFRTDPFSHALTWNVFACILLSSAAIGKCPSAVVLTSGAIPYLPLTDRSLFYNDMLKKIISAMWLAVISCSAIAAALTQSGLPWYTIIYFAIITMVGQCAIGILLAETPIVGVLSRIFGHRGLHWFFFPWYGLELLGILPAAFASWTITRLCLAWYETGPTDVA